MTEAILPYMSGIHFVSIKGQNLALPPQSLEGLYVWTGHSLCTLARQALYDSAVRVALCLLFYMIMDKIINLIWLVVPSLLVLCWIRTLTAINIPVSYKSCFVWRVSSAYVCLTVVRWTTASPRILKCKGWVFAPRDKTTSLVSLPCVVKIGWCRMKETLNLKGSKATGPSLLNLRHIHIIDNVRGVSQIWSG